MRFLFHRNQVRLRALAGALSASMIAPQMLRAAPAPEARRTLSNGATLIERVDRTSPRIAISLLVRAGAADETATSAGWRRLLADAMLRAAKNPTQSTLAGANGTGTNAGDGEFLTARQMQREAERGGGRLAASVGDDVIEFSVSGDSGQSARLAQLLLALVRTPRLSDADIDGARKALVERLDREENDVATRATTELRGRLYRDARGELVAYGLPPAGTLDSLSSLTNERVRELHRQFFGPSNWMVGAAGDIENNALQSAVEAVAKESGQTSTSQAAPFLKPADPNAPPLTVRQYDTPGAWIFVAFATGDQSGGAPDDWPALRVLSAILGETRSARLPRRLLQPRLGVAGTKPSAERVVVQFAPRRFRGEFVAFAQTSPQGVEGVKNAILDEIRRLRETPLNASELKSAKAYVRGLWPVERESLRERAYQSALAAALSSPTRVFTDADWPARIDKLTPADIQRAAQKYLKTYAVALILPRE